ncbi:XkdF-like putative serine protease domain-containing protein [Azospirillum himalayense]|uniref:XkdF-like putative serine protease domain-containing protein n=1 Tax=Azospirillum himalayense TaxID=654847 RepID=A0ABW0GB36_9PROT
MPAPLSFLDALKAQAEGSAAPVTTTANTPLTFGKALAQTVEKGHFRHADGKFRVGTPVALADLEDIAADVPDDDAGLLDAVAKFQAGEVPPPIDIAVDPEGNRALVRGKKRLAAARKTGQTSIPVRFTQVKEVFGKAASGAAQDAPVPARTLQPIDDKTSYPPFPYDQTVFARLRPDQVPRFLGVLTDRERWPLQPVKLDQLLAMQNRVDTGKVMAKVENGGGGHEPIVVMLEPGRLHIADGHHDLAAAWLRGEVEKAVRFADLTPVTNVLKADLPVAPGTLVKVKEEHRADNWFLEQVGDALGEVIASWIVQEGENTGKVALAVEWLTPSICGMYRGLDAAKVEVVTTPTSDITKAAATIPAVGDLIDFDDDRFTDKGPASGTVAFVVPKSKTIIVNFGDGYPEDLETIYWPAVTKKAKAERRTKPSGKVVWSVHGKPDDQQEQPGADGVSKGAGAGTADRFILSANICKVDDDQRLVFGWFSIVEIDGQPVTDREGDRIAPDELEPAAYGHVLNARVASDTHVLIGVGKLVESCVFTLEKQQAMVASLIAMGIPAVMDLHCVGWWGGYYITDDKVWAEIKAGNYVSFSIGGTGTRTPAAG